MIETIFYVLKTYYSSDLRPVQLPWSWTSRQSTRQIGCACSLWHRSRSRWWSCHRKTFACHPGECRWARRWCAAELLTGGQRMGWGSDSEWFLLCTLTRRLWALRRLRWGFWLVVVTDELCIGPSRPCSMRRWQVTGDWEIGDLLSNEKKKV